MSGVEKVYATDTPGIVLHRHRGTFTVDGERKRLRYYVLVHEPSGLCLLQGRGSTTKAIPSLDAAMHTARVLGDVRWRRKPFDWTQDVEVIRGNDRVGMALRLVSGWVSLTDYDKATKEWAARNDISLAFPVRKVAA